MTIAVCPGSFDPITLGHLDIVRRACQLFDRVIVGVAHNSAKSTAFGAEERLELVRLALAEAHVQAEARIVPGLLVDFCRGVGAQAIVKGLRGGADFDAELPMALVNRHIGGGVETVFVAGDGRYAHIASSLVKDIARHGGPVRDMVPRAANDALRRVFGEPAANSDHEREELP